MPWCSDGLRWVHQGPSGRLGRWPPHPLARWWRFPAVGAAAGGARIVGRPRPDALRPAPGPVAPPPTAGRRVPRTGADSSPDRSPDRSRGGRHALTSGTEPPAENRGGAPDRRCRVLRPARPVQICRWKLSTNYSVVRKITNYCVPRSTASMP